MLVIVYSSPDISCIFFSHSRWME